MCELQNIPATSLPIRNSHFAAMVAIALKIVMKTNYFLQTVSPNWKLLPFLRLMDLLC